MKTASWSLSLTAHLQYGKARILRENRKDISYLYQLCTAVQQHSRGIVFENERTFVCVYSIYTDNF